MKFVELAKSLEGGPESIYLLEGEETYFLDHAVKQIRAACKITQPLFNDAREEGDSLKGEKLSSLIAALRSLPLFDEKRLIRVYDFYPSEREWESVLKPYAESPSPSGVLVIVNSRKKNSGCDLKKKKQITFVDCSRADAETLEKWVFSLVRREGLEADADVCEKLVAFCGLNAARIKSEIIKLKLLLGEGARITSQIVEEHIERDAEYKIYELTQAASRGNFSRFEEILSDFLEKGGDESAALSALASHFKTLTELSFLGGSDADVGALLSLKPYAVKKNREILTRLSKARAEELFKALYNLGCKLRCGDYSKSGALDSAVAQIFFG